MVNSSNTDTFTRDLKYEWQPWEAGDLKSMFTENKGWSSSSAKQFF
jgi:hypothetical protein